MIDKKIGFTQKPYSQTSLNKLPSTKTLALQPNTANIDAINNNVKLFLKSFVTKSEKIKYFYCHTQFFW